MTIDFKQVSRIIKLSLSNGIKRIKIGEVEIEFGDSNQNTKKKMSKQEMFNSEEHARIETIKDREMRLAQMDIEDPYAYEQLLLRDSGEKDFVNGETQHSGTQ